MHRFGAIGASLVFLCFCPDGFPDRLAVIGWHVHFETKLARKAHTEEPGWHAADFAQTHAHMRHGFVRDIDAVNQRRNDLARIRALHRNHRILLGGRGQRDFQVRELGLEIVFHMVQHARRTARCGGDVEAIFRDAAHHAVIHHKARFVEHQAIAATAHFEL